MNGAHDMGGMHGFGAVQPEADEPWFHAEWERRAFAVTLAMGAAGEWNLDMSRSAREARSPADYLSMSYYELWVAGLEKLMGERGLIGENEIAAAKALRPPKPVARVLAAKDVAAVLRKGASTARPATGQPRFGIGDRVRARNINPATHTRLPRYLRGHAGVITLVHGCHVFPDTHATGAGEDPQWLYTVSFSAFEVFGPDADPSVSICVDCWEPYLEHA